jgi:RNA polymerase sigma-70 factor, ECF subfamily
VPFVPPVPQDLTDELLLGSLRRLPSVFQEVILLCDIEELSYKEAAEALRIPIGTVMSRLHRGRAQLRSELVAADTSHERVEAL